MLPPICNLKIRRKIFDNYTVLWFKHPIMKAKGQTELDLKVRGRPPKKGDKHKTSNGMVAHIPRPDMDKTTPIHINMKVREDLPNLRKKSIYKFLKEGVKKARGAGLKVIHFALVSNHIHFIVEADSKGDLSKGMRSFLIIFAMKVNRSLKRKGSLFVDRYNMEVIRIPTRMRYLLSYVFKNNSKHQKKKFETDPYSSLIVFEGQEILFGEKIPIPFDLKVREKLKEFLSDFLSPPSSWLASKGRKRGKIKRSTQ